MVPFNKSTTKAHKIIWMPEGVRNGLAKNACDNGVADYMFLKIYVVKCILEDDIDLVSEFLGNSLSGLLEFSISWDDWLDDQIQVQHETLMRIGERAAVITKRQQKAEPASASAKVSAGTEGPKWTQDQLGVLIANHSDKIRKGTISILYLPLIPLVHSVGVVMRVSTPTSTLT
jgi:hypothetical protein